MNLPAYRRKHPCCELLKHFPTVGRSKVVPGYVEFPLFGRQCEVEAHHIHHVIGGDKRGRTDDERNVLHLNIYVHEFVTDHSCAGRILSAYELLRKQKLDCEFLASISRKCWPSVLDTDPYIDAAERFKWIEPYRLQLIAVIPRRNVS